MRIYQFDLPRLAEADASGLLARTRLIITATTSAQPVLPDEPALLKGKHFISIGSFRRQMQELAVGLAQAAP